MFGYDLVIARDPRARDILDETGVAELTASFFVQPLECPIDGSRAADGGTVEDE